MCSLMPSCLLDRRTIPDGFTFSRIAKTGQVQVADEGALPLQVAIAWAIASGLAWLACGVGAQGRAYFVQRRRGCLREHRGPLPNSNTSGKKGRRFHE